MSYDITKHLSYNVDKKGGGALAGAPALDVVVVRPLGKSVPPNNQEEMLPTLTAELMKHGRVKPGRMISVTFPAGLQLDLAVMHCEPLPESGVVGVVRESTRISLVPNPLPVITKCHILPYEDAKPPNPNLIYSVYIKPYLLERCGPLRDGFEFAFNSCRFRVMATIPAFKEGDTLYAASTTEIFHEGPPIQRPILRSVKMLPFFDTLPAGGMDDATRVAIVRRHFEQRSMPVEVKEEIATEEGVHFRVLQCEPSRGGVMPSTKVICDGPPLMACRVCGGMAVKRCDAPDCKKLLCTVHAKQVVQDGATKTYCPEHGGSSCVLQ